MIRPRTREGQNNAYIVSAHSKNHYGIGLGFRSGLHGPLQAKKNRNLSLQPFLRSWDALEEGSCSLRRAKQQLSTAGSAAKAWGSRHPPHPRRQPTTAAGVGARGARWGMSAARRTSPPLQRWWRGWRWRRRWRTVEAAAAAAAAVAASAVTAAAAAAATPRVVGSALRAVAGGRAARGGGGQDDTHVPQASWQELRSSS